MSEETKLSSLKNLFEPDSLLGDLRGSFESLASDHKLPHGKKFSIPEQNHMTDLTYYGKVFRATVDMLNTLGCGNLSHSFLPSGDAMSASAVEGYTLSAVSKDTVKSSLSALVDLCKTCNVPEERIMSTVECLAQTLYNYTNNNADNHFDVSDGSTLSGFRRLNTIYPSGIVADATYTGNLIGREMFGANMQQKIVDIKTAMAITIVKAYKGTTARVFHRVANDTGYVVFLVPNDEFYDLAKSQGKTSAERDSWSHRNQLITLRTHPEPVDMELIPVKLRKDMDKGNKYLVADDVMLPNVEVPMWDMANDEGKIGHDIFDYTDLLSNQVNLRAVHIEVTSAAGGTPVTEQFVLNLENFPNLTTYTHLNNTHTNQADRGCMFAGRFPFDKDTEQADGTRSTIFSSLNRSTEYVICKLNFNSKVNLQNARINGSGGVEFIGAVSVPNGTLSTATTDLLNGLTYTIVGWSVDAKYSEENFRKTNMAIRSLSDVFTYTTPDGRTIVADHSHRQALAEHTLKVASEVQCIGIDHRNLQISIKTVRATEARIRNERTDARYIENYDNVTVSKAFVSGRKINPTMAIKTIDMSKVVNFKSSDMMSDSWTYMRVCLNAITSEINYRSLMSQALEDRAMKYKVVSDPRLIETVWSLASIHESQMPNGAKGEQIYEVKVQGKAIEFKTSLPNGVELEFVTDAKHYLKNQMLMLPYVDNAPMDDLNFAVNVDNGQYSVNWAPTDGRNATWRRTMQNTREYPIVLCGVAAMVTVTGLDTLIPGMYDL